MLLHCQQHNNNFLQLLNNSQSECALKKGIALMINGDIKEGKAKVLDYISSVIYHKKLSGKMDCFGSEYSRFLQAFNHVWKLKLYLKCNSKHCPNKFSCRNQTTFSLQPVIKVSFEQQLRQHFPYPEDMVPGGYCGASEFQCDPSPDVPCNTK